MFGILDSEDSLCVFVHDCAGGLHIETHHVERRQEMWIVGVVLGAEHEPADPSILRNRVQEHSKRTLHQLDYRRRYFQPEVLPTYQ